MLPRRESAFDYLRGEFAEREKEMSGTTPGRRISYESV